MARPCVVGYCENIGTHRFPKNEIRKTQWIQAIENVKHGLTPNSLVCSAHFRISDFAVTPSYWKNYRKSGAQTNRILRI